MRAVVVLLALGLTACPPKPPVPPVTPPDVFDKMDAAPEMAVPSDPSTCAAACERLWLLGCKGGRPTPKGATCIEFCRNVQESGIVSWDLRCLSSASSCAAADRCR